MTGRAHERLLQINQWFTAARTPRYSLPANGGVGRCAYRMDGVGHRGGAMAKARICACMGLAVLLASAFALPALARPTTGAVTACLGDATGANFAGTVNFIAPGFDPTDAVGAPATSAPIFLQPVIRN